jgi:16S rRNA (cytosine967-C5)-methyltransferase
MARLRENFARLALEAEAVVSDAGEWQGGKDGGGFDGILVDAPCTSTGTIRRHPDIPWLKREGDIPELAKLQRRLLARAVELTRPGGILVYCTCSLEPEEGVDLIDDLLARDSRLRRRPVAASEVGGLDAAVTAAGDLRTLPCHLPDPNPQLAGIDGFYAARLERL